MFRINRQVFLKTLTAAALGFSTLYAATAAAPRPAAAQTAVGAQAGQIIATGERFMGTPYQYGAKSGRTDRFDCSSFVQYVYGQNGVSLPRSSRQQSHVGAYVAKSNLRPGDLVFFYNPIHHVAIYIGDGKLLHTYGGPGVTISSLNSSWWRNHYTTARRVLNASGDAGSGSGSVGSGGSVQHLNRPADIVRSVSFREAPSLHSPRLRYLGKGERVTVLDKVNAYWYRVQDRSGKIGYVTTMSKYIRLSQGAGQVSSQGGATAQIVRTVNFHEAPSVNSPRIRYLRQGETVRILDKINAYWYRAQDRNGKIGYVTTMSKYIRVSQSAGQSPSQGGATAKIVRTVNFHEAPSVNSPRIRYLRQGETVRILDKINAYWYRVQDSSGKIGYLTTMSKYVQA